MQLQIIWFILWGTLWAVYFMLDGFDFGAGMLQGFLAKEESQKRLIHRAVGSVWDGNEVWLLTAGGATFAAFPTAYALMFSYLYSALLLILFSLILRGIALEFRQKAESQRWQNLWDYTARVTSLLLSVLFGVAFGNIFRGLPMDSSGYHGSLLSLLNPYGLLTGIAFVALFFVHGALWLSVRMPEDLSHNSAKTANTLWPVLTLILICFLISTAFVTNLYNNYLENPLLFIVPIVAVAALFAIKVFLIKGMHFKAFLSSCALILTFTFTGVIGLYPNLIPSSISPEHSLTIFNSSSSPYTLKIMTLVAVIFVPIVIAYQVWVHKTLGKVSQKDIIEEEGY